MLRYLPLLLAVAAIATAASWDFIINTDIAGEAQAWAEKLEKDVPKEIGPWVGIDTPVSENDRLVAGAEGYISRSYKHSETGDTVGLWLIVGHMQGVTRHAPTACYVNSGYKQKEKKGRYEFNVEGQPPAEFWTSWFLRDSPERGLERQRVFWAWARPKKKQESVWKASGNPRFEYAGTKALFKMYFMVDEPEDSPGLEQNPANEFAELVLPLLADLFEEGIAPAASSSESSDASATSETTEPEQSDAAA